MMYQMIIYHLVVIVNMMTVETLIIKLGVNPKEISKAELIPVSYTHLTLPTTERV